MRTKKAVNLLRLIMNGIANRSRKIQRASRFHQDHVLVFVQIIDKVL